MEGMDDTQHQPQQQAAAGASAADSSSSSSSSHAGILAALRAPPSLTAQPAFLSGHNARSPNRHVPAMPAKHSSAAFARPTDGQASSAAAAAAAAPAFPSAAASPASSSSASTLGLPQQLKHLLSPPSPRQAKKRSSAQYDVGEAVASAAAPNAMDDKPAAAAPAAVLPPQSKRTRAHSDDDDDDDADDDEDDRDDDGMDDNVRSSGGGSKGRWLEEDADSSFLSLLGKLAKLEFPDQLEQCPCCPEKFPLSEFATHVYTCIQKLDDVEKKEQEQLDAKLAERLARADGSYEHSRRRRGLQHYGRSVTPEAVEDQERELLEQFASSRRDVCELGKECTRTDASHFELLAHPDVACPMCDEEYPVYEINAHITICLDRPASQRTKKKIADADAMMDGSAVPKGGMGSSSGSASAFPSGAFSSTAISIPASLLSSGASAQRIRARKLAQRSSSSNGLSGVGSSPDELGLLASPDDEDDDAAADDEADDEDAMPPRPAPAHAHAAAAAAAAAAEESKSAAGGSHPSLVRSHSEHTLSLAQASAVASLMINKHKESAAVPRANGEKDPSLLELLNTFSSLGFTRENLEALHAKHTEEQDKGGAKQP